MRERVMALSGDLSLHSAPGQGTTVVVSIPLAISRPGQPLASGSAWPQLHSLPNVTAGPIAYARHAHLVRG